MFPSDYHDGHAEVDAFYVKGYLTATLPKIHFYVKGHCEFIKDTY